MTFSLPKKSLLITYCVFATFNVQSLFAQNHEIVGAIIDELIDAVFTMLAREEFLERKESCDILCRTISSNSMNEINNPSIDPTLQIDTPLTSFNLKTSKDEEKGFRDNKAITPVPEHLSFSSHPEEIDSSFQKENLPPRSKAHVSFSFPSNQEEETDPFPSSPIKNIRSQKTPSPEIKEQKKLTRALQDWCSKIESEAAILPEEEIDVSTKRAAIYAQGYSKVKEKLHALLSLIENNSTLQNEQSVKTLADAAGNLIIIASRTVATENVKPIKEHYHFGDNSLEIPVEILSKEETIPIEDSEASIAVSRTINTLQDLQEAKNVFNASNPEIIKVLNKSQRLRAYRAYLLARIKCKSIIKKKEFLLKNSNTSSETLAQVTLEHEKILASEKEHDDFIHYNFSLENTLSDPEEAKRKAIDDIITISRTSLEVADQLIEMLHSRKIS
ncbi:MAG TPA: hypothetical protein VJK54_01770 [Chthoniobacterales bacterium]|nr:hypothetical protein [Chthoniobacterales bacterium]